MRSFLLFLLLPLTAFRLLSTTTDAAEVDEPITLTVTAGDFDRRDTPLRWRLPESLWDAADFELVRFDKNRAVPVQRIDAPLPTVCWVLEEPLAAGESRQYQLRPVNDIITVNDRVSISGADGRLIVEVDDRPLLHYQVQTAPSPVPEEPYYARSGFIHPVFTPTGAALTDDFPPDHLHQHGLFFAYVSTQHRGREVDFWNSFKRQGLVRHAKLLGKQSGPVAGTFAVALEHVVTPEDEPEQIALVETWHVTAYRTPSGFLFDLHSEQQATDHPLLVQKNAYGGLGVRGARHWTRDAAHFTTSEGKDRTSGNHTAARWVDLAGPTPTGQGGLTVLSHPRNLRAPQPVRLHPAMPYFCFAPMVEGEFTLEPGEPHTSLYRFHPHDGELNADEANRLWNDFAHPPTITAK